MPRRPPNSRSGRVYEAWLIAQPTHTDYLDLAYEYLDDMEGYYSEWRMQAGSHGSTWPESDEMRARRARRLAQTWIDGRFTNGELQNLMRMDPAQRRESARLNAENRMNNRGPNDELFYYHNINPLALGAIAWGVLVVCRMALYLL